MGERRIWWSESLGNHIYSNHSFFYTVGADEFVKSLPVDAVELVPARPAPDTEAPSEDEELICGCGANYGAGCSRECMQPVPTADELLDASSADNARLRADLAARDRELAESRAEVQRLTDSRDEYRDWFRDLRARRFRLLELCDLAERGHPSGHRITTRGIRAALTLALPADAPGGDSDGE